MTESKAPVLTTEAEDVAWLERGWAWLVANPQHPRHDEFEDAWIARLRAYERTYTIWLEAMKR